MKPADSVMAGKASDGSIKWQLCYDISARTWWMVSWQPGLPFFFLFYFPSLFDKMSQTSHSSNSRLIFSHSSARQSHSASASPSLHSAAPLPAALALCAGGQGLEFAPLLLIFLTVSEVLRWSGRSGQAMSGTKRDTRLPLGLCPCSGWLSWLWCFLRTHVGHWAKPAPSGRVSCPAGGLSR